MTRVALAILLFLSAIFLPIWLVAPLAAVYAWYYFAIEIIFMATFIDAYFGVTTDWPYYTLFALVVVLASLYIKTNFTIFDTNQ